MLFRLAGRCVAALTCVVHVQSVAPRGAVHRWHLRMTFYLQSVESFARFLLLQHHVHVLLLPDLNHLVQRRFEEQSLLLLDCRVGVLYGGCLLRSFGPLAQAFNQDAVFSISLVLLLDLFQESSKLACAHLVLLALRDSIFQRRPQFRNLAPLMRNDTRGRAPRFN